MTDWKDTFDFVYKAVTGLVSLATLGILFKIGLEVGAWKEWVKTTDKEMSSMGGMMQQLNATVAKILGREEGRKERKDD